MNELVYLKNDVAVCDSLQVAEKFGKRHADAIRAIENLIKNDPTQNCVRCFKKMEKLIQEKSTAAYQLSDQAEKATRKTRVFAIAY